MMQGIDKVVNFALQPQEQPKKKTAELQKRCDGVIARYGDFSKFIQTYHPSIQEVTGKNVDRVFTGTAPTLGILDSTYGTISQVLKDDETGKEVRVNCNASALFIATQLHAVQMFCGIKEKKSVAELISVGETITSVFYYLKVSEFCLFCLWLKCGKYGRFYGVIDPLIITNSLQQFAKDRFDHIDKYEKEVQRQQLLEQKPSKTAITYEEFLKRQKDKENEQQQSQF